MGNVTPESTGTIKTTSGTPDTPLSTLVVQMIPRICPHTPDGAIMVAAYIVQEIKTNVKSDTARMIRYHIDPAEIEKRRQQREKLPPQVRIKSPIPKADLIAAKENWFFAVNGFDIPVVIDNGKWNHKPKIRELFRDYAVRRPLRPWDDVGIWKWSETYYHKYKDHDYFLDVWSNIHYAYVGLSVGFDEATLLEGSNQAQLRTSATKGGDTIDDITSMNIGFALYKKFGQYAEGLTPQDVLDALEQVPLSKMPEAKDVHWCWHERNDKKATKP